MVFVVISFAEGLTSAEHEEAAAGAPPCTDTCAPYAELLEDSGWKIRQQLDVTAEFGAISTRELAAFESRSQRLREVLGDEEFSDRLALRTAKVSGIRAGAIRRELFVATPAC